MPFLVISPGYPPSSGSGFVLRQDRWNDYSFQTQYQLFHGKDSGLDLIGDVKILRKGQTSQDGLQLQLGTFDLLDENWCSIGQSLDYYERLAALGVEQRDMALKGLRDVIYDPTLVEQFNSEPGWRISLFRDFDLDADFVATARALISRDYDSLPNLALQLSFKPAGWKTALSIDFSAPTSRLESSFSFVDLRSPQLPARIAVLIGRNGSGKSTLLARLARVAYASARDRKRPQLLNIGVLEPAGIGFTRIVAISFSAFDSFTTPGLDLEEQRQVAREIKSGVGRYMFCGLRDIAREAEELDKAPDDPTSENDADRLSGNRIKSLDQLALEFSSAIERIVSSGRSGILIECARPLLLEPSLYTANDANVLSLLSGDPASKFLAMSTGHKIVLHALASVVSYVEKKSLVLFDEPETHLHPPLLAAFTHSLRTALSKLDAFAIVATHSPVLVQETLAKHVFKVTREGSAGVISPPEIETFGESIGAITNDVFALDAASTDYHVILQRIAGLYEDVESVEGIFDRGLSSQARAYVMSAIASRKASKA